jgi:UDP-GlcNAc:undecaprenyl-phosphate GlcNAc-1-phosphate transferase
MTLFYFKIFITTLLFSSLLTYFIIKIAYKFNVVDKPSLERKIHKKNTPLMGGTAIFICFFAILFILKNHLLSENLQLSHWLGFFIGSTFLIFGGILDDKFSLKPGYQLLFPLLAIFSLLIGGVEIEKITNPFSGFIFLNNWKFDFSFFGYFPIKILIFSDLLLFIWLFVLMYTTKVLDGVDGLVDGLVFIGAIIIFIFTISSKYYQPDIALAALVLGSACLGFLVFNWHPAKIFLGEGGSLFLGFSLGTLAIISGGKIAITLLVMGLPLLDLFWTVIRRLSLGVNPLTNADKNHLHHKILKITGNQRTTVLIYYFIAIIFGLSGLFCKLISKYFLFCYN